MLKQQLVNFIRTVELKIKEPFSHFFFKSIFIPDFISKAITLNSVITTSIGGKIPTMGLLDFHSRAWHCVAKSTPGQRSDRGGGWPTACLLYEWVERNTDPLFMSLALFKHDHATCVASGCGRSLRDERPPADRKRFKSKIMCGVKVIYFVCVHFFLLF